MVAQHLILATQLLNVIQGFEFYTQTYMVQERKFGQQCKKIAVFLIPI